MRFGIMHSFKVINFVGSRPTHGNIFSLQFFPFEVLGEISSIFDKCPDRVITSITAKPYILQKTLFHWIYSKLLRFNMGIFFLSSNLMEAVRGQKHPSEAKNGIWKILWKILILWKKFLIKVVQQPQKLLDRSNQLWAMTSVKKDSFQQPARLLYSSINATLCCCCWKDISNSRARPKVLISTTL
jgi:hypothetical protein